MASVAWNWVDPPSRAQCVEPRVAFVDDDEDECDERDSSRCSWDPDSSGTHSSCGSPCDWGSTTQPCGGRTPVSGPLSKSYDPGSCMEDGVDPLPDPSADATMPQWSSPVLPAAGSEGCRKLLSEGCGELLGTSLAHAGTADGSEPCGLADVDMDECDDAPYNGPLCDARGTEGNLRRVNSLQRMERSEALGFSASPRCPPTRPAKPSFMYFALGSHLPRGSPSSGTSCDTPHAQLTCLLSARARPYSVSSQAGARVQRAVWGCASAPSPGAHALSSLHAQCLGKP